MGLLTSIEEIVERAIKESSGLTQRRQEVLLLISEGMTNEQIAGQLSVKKRTVGRHVSGICDRLGVKGRTLSTVAVRYCIEQNGTYEPPFAINKPGLTRRQAEIFSLAGRGLTNPEIEELLVVAKRTVERHIGMLKGALPIKFPSLRRFWAYAAWHAYAARPPAEGYVNGSKAA